MDEVTLDGLTRQELSKLQDENFAEQDRLQGRITKARVRYNRTGRPEDLETLKRLIAERQRVKREGHLISGAWARAEGEAARQAGERWAEQAYRAEVEQGR